MSDDDKALVESMRERIAVWDRNEPRDDWWADQIEYAKAADRIEALSAENERLREAGKDLGFYAGHDDSCDCVKGWAKGPCNCGYTETWNQWRTALGESHD